MAEKRSAAVWFAVCAGAGDFPVAPGTAGSAVGVALVVAIAQIPAGRLAQSLIVVVAALALGALGVGAATEAEKFFGKKDPGKVVMDEVVGQMLTLAAWPAAKWPWLLAGFLVFRALDVLKPFPARRMEHLPGGWGIMLDDVVAGIYGLVIMAMAQYFLR